MLINYIPENNTRSDEVDEDGVKVTVDWFTKLGKLQRSELNKLKYKKLIQIMHVKL